MKINIEIFDDDYKYDYIWEKHLPKNGNEIEELYRGDVELISES